jgi:DNA-binding transcriptional ArsR family regulator
MGASKSDYFTENQNTLADLFKALGHPARIAILEHIIQLDSCICNDLVNVLPLSQSTVSQHLRELKNANIIKGSIEGNSVCYCINQETLELIQQIISNYSSQNQTNNKCC